MQKTKLHLGLYWTPSVKKVKFAGIIFFENNQIYLQIYGGPIPGTEYMKYDLNFHDSFPLVHGECLEYDKVTLVNLKLESFKGINGRARYVYVAEYLIIGGLHLKDIDKPLITYSMLSFFKMNEFLNEKVIEWDDFFKNGVNAKMQVQNKPAKILFKNRYREDYFYHRLKVTNVANPENDFIRSSFFYNTKFKKRITFVEFINNWKGFQAMFSIATTKNRNIKSAYFKCNDEEFEVITTDILYNDDSGEDRTKSLVIKYEDVEQAENKPFERWMFHFNSIEHSVTLFQNAKKNIQEIGSKNYFLNMFICNESILKVILGQIPPVEKIPTKILGIADRYDIQGNDRNSLLSKFKKENATCLTYFQELQQKIPNVIKKLFGEHYMVKIAEAKNTRDQFVHKNSETIKKVIVREKELQVMANKLRILFQANCLLFMGFEQAKIEKMIFRSPYNNID